MLLYLKLQIGKCKLKILFFQFSFFNYFTRSLEDRLETRKKIDKKTQCLGIFVAMTHEITFWSAP